MLRFDEKNISRYSTYFKRLFKTSHTMHFLPHSFCFSVSQSAAPYYMNMSSTIKKKVTLCETSIVDLNTERKDRQDARWRDPARQDKQRKRSLRDKFNQNSL